MKASKYIEKNLVETVKIAQKIKVKEVEKILEILTEIKSQNGRIFFLGVGGGAGTGSHAANDFNKIAKISSICLSDNPSLVTALTNDEGWETVFKRQLEMHQLSPSDCLFIYSVGGGTETISKNLVLAINYAQEIGAKVVGVVGKKTGYTAKKADACIVIPCLNNSTRTPHTEDFQLIMDHLLINYLSKSKKQNEK